jgi:hypothetical protein
MAPYFRAGFLFPTNLPASPSLKLQQSKAGSRATKSDIEIDKIIFVPLFVGNIHSFRRTIFSSGQSYFLFGRSLSV